MYYGERFNSITHLVGTVMAIVGTYVLISTAAMNGAGPRRIAAFAVYGAMMVVLYLSSTLYHSIKGPAKQVFHVFDHCAIYLLIAGTYTPFTLVTHGRGRAEVELTVADFFVARDSRPAASKPSRGH